MREEPTRGNPTGESPAVLAGSGWVNTKVAAEALGVDPRTVRTYINRGELDARVEGEGVEKAYLVSIDSVYSLRERKGRSRKTRDSTRDISARLSQTAEYAEDITDMVRGLTTQLIRSSSEAAELRARLELTEQAESSRREALEQRLEAERVRREFAEQERDRLAAELEVVEEALEEALEEVRESPERPAEEPALTHTPPIAEPPFTEGETLEDARLPWWRRWFG